jgi:hypothetical protein
LSPLAQCNCKRKSDKKMSFKLFLLDMVYVESLTDFKDLLRFFCGWAWRTNFSRNRGQCLASKANVHNQSTGAKTCLSCSTNDLNLMNSLNWINKMARANSLTPSSSGIIVLPSDNQIGKIAINLSYLWAWEIHSQASTRALSDEKSNPAGRIGKKGVLVNTPTLAWVYTRTFKERGRRDR